MLLLLIVWADTATTSDPLAWLVNLGVAGVVIVLFVTGQIRTKAEVENLKEQIAGKDQLISAFQLQLTGHTLPALERSAQVLEAIPSSDRALHARLQQAQAEVAQLAQRLENLTRGESET